jgi:hypothetical protein
MISVNHSCGLLGVDCGNTHRRLTDRSTSVFHPCMRYVSVILFAHKLVLKVRSSWGGPNRAECALARIELANRICMEQVVTIPGHDSAAGPGDRISSSHFRSSRSRCVFLPRDVSCFPAGTAAAGLRRICRHTHAHAHVVTARVPRLYFRNCSVVPLDAP